MLSLLLVISIICLIVGLIKPTVFSFIFGSEVTRRRVGSFFSLIVFLLFTGLSVDNTPKETTNTSKSKKVDWLVAITEAPVTLSPKDIEFHKKMTSMIVPEWDAPGSEQQRIHEIKEEADRKYLSSVITSIPEGTKCVYIKHFKEDIIEVRPEDNSHSYITSLKYFKKME